MAKKAALEVIAKGRLHMEWDTAVKIISMIKVGQISGILITTVIQMTQAMGQP